MGGGGFVLEAGGELQAKLQEGRESGEEGAGGAPGVQTGERGGDLSGEGWSSANT